MGVSRRGGGLDRGRGWACSSWELPARIVTRGHHAGFNPGDQPSGAQMGLEPPGGAQATAPKMSKQPTSKLIKYFNADGRTIKFNHHPLLSCGWCRRGCRPGWPGDLLPVGIALAINSIDAGAGWLETAAFIGNLIASMELFLVEGSFIGKRRENQLATLAEPGFDQITVVIRFGHRDGLPENSDILVCPVSADGLRRSIEGGIGRQHRIRNRNPVRMPFVTFTIPVFTQQEFCGRYRRRAARCHPGCAQSPTAHCSPGFRIC